MGRSRYRVLEQDAPHSVTLTVLNWIPLFTRPATVEILFGCAALAPVQPIQSLLGDWLRARSPQLASGR